MKMHFPADDSPANDIPDYDTIYYIDCIEIAISPDSVLCVGIKILSNLFLLKRWGKNLFLLLYGHFYTYNLLSVLILLLLLFLAGSENRNN